MSDSIDNAYMAMLQRTHHGVGPPPPTAGAMSSSSSSSTTVNMELTPLQDSAVNVLAKAANGALYVTEGEAALEPVCIPASLLAQTQTSMSPTWSQPSTFAPAATAGETAPPPRRSSITTHHLPSPAEFITILEFLKTNNHLAGLLAHLPLSSSSSSTEKKSSPSSSSSNSEDGQVQCELVSDIRSVLHPSDPGMPEVLAALSYLFLTKPHTNASVADAPVPTATLPSMSTQLRHQEPKNGHLSPSTATLDLHEAQHRYLATYRVYVRGSTRVQVWILGALNDGSLVGYQTTAIET